MLVNLKIEDARLNEKNPLTVAFHADVQNSSEAELKLANAPVGSFLTFSNNKRNYCSAVWENGEIVTNPLHWNVSGLWENGTGGPFLTLEDLLAHLVNGLTPIAFTQR